MAKLHTYCQRRTKNYLGDKGWCLHYRGHKSKHLPSSRQFELFGRHDECCPPPPAQAGDRPPRQEGPAR